MTAGTTRRAPGELQLWRRVAAGDDVRPTLRAVVRDLATFHEKARRAPAITSAGGLDTLDSMWNQAYDRLSPYLGSLVDAETADHTYALAARYLNGRGLLLAQRIRDGFVVAGHDGVTADGIYCLDDGPLILGATELDSRFPDADVLLDVAGLMVDLEQMGRADLARDLLRYYSDCSDANHPATLVEHYLGYSAFGRCRIACTRHDQGDARACDEALRLLRSAAAHLERGQVTAVFVGGAPGTGKTSLAHELAAAFGWSVLSSDLVRRQVSVEPPSDGFDDAATAAVYSELSRREDRLLHFGQSVVLDASWEDRSNRNAAKVLALRAGATVVELQCTAPADVALRRLADRERRDPSERHLDPQLTTAVRERFHAWPSAVAVSA